MSNFYFFTDPTLLDAQVAAQAFGPAGTAAGKDLFRITDVHTSTSTNLPAVAICDGVLCAQEDDQGALTLILKPSQTPPFESPVVSYFIYKGVAKTSLLNGDQILDENASKATVFTKRIAAEWKKQNTNDLTGSRAALGLDRDAGFKHVEGASQVNIFADNDPVDRLFNYPHKTVQLPTVSAGDVIGSFQSSCGFEIVLHRLGYKPKLAFARHANNEISVASLPADNNGAPWQADDYAFFSHWHEKEQVLAFMDPCAFFGSFVQAKLYKKSGGSASRVKGSDIYDEILQKFANRNVAWLDIRNNYSYSYNLFGLYDDTIRFVSHSNASQTNDKNFRSGLWPILRLEIADVPGSKRGSLHRTKVCLPVGLSTAPAVLVSKGFVKNLGPERPRFKSPAIAKANAADTHYTPFRLAFPVTVDNSKKVLTASYTRINIYEKSHPDPQPAAPLNVVSREYLDGVFRLRDLRLGKDFAGNKLRFEIYPEEVLVNLEKEYGPTYSASVGIAEDAKHVALFAFPNCFLPNLYDSGRRQPLPSWANTATNGAEDFLMRLAETFRFNDITKRIIRPDNASKDFDTLLVLHEPSVDHNPMSDENSLNDFCIVVLEKADHESLLDAIAADIHAVTRLPAFLTVLTSETKHDTTHHLSFGQYTLQNIGYMKAGNKAAQQTTALTLALYEYEGSFPSAVSDTTYKEHKALQLKTTLLDVPGYGLFFDVPDDYKADAYAFDDCADFDEYDHGRLDINIMISRYERLFRYDRKRYKQYYLVPWLAIPYTKDNAGACTLGKSLIELKLSRNSIYHKKPPPTYAPVVKTRRLKLVPSSPGDIQAIWKSRENETTDKDVIESDITKFSSQSVLIDIANKCYGEAGESIEVRDLTDGKTVGKIRLLFLEKIKQKVFFIDVSTTKISSTVDDDDAFQFKLADFSDPRHESLESDGAPGFVHNKLYDDVNKYGFNKIGIEFEVVNDTVDLVLNAGSGPFSQMDLLPNSPSEAFNKSVVKVRRLGDLDYYAELFVNTIHYAQSRQSASEKFNKYSILYAFVTPFKFEHKGKHLLGLTQLELLPNDVLTLGQEVISPVDLQAFQVKHAHPVSLSLAVGVRPRLSKAEGQKFAGRDHLYSTLAHELMHALSVSHSFDDDSEFEAERYLTLYLLHRYPFAFHNIKIEDLVHPNSNETLFDRIIDNGMNTALSEFIDRIYSPDPRPAEWSKPYTHESIGDELIWVSLNMLAAFKQYKTKNIQDYLSTRKNKSWSEPLRKPNFSSPSGVYFKRQPLWINRFQWELARKAVSYFNNLGPPP